MWNYGNYKSDTNGNVAMMFAVSTLMMLTGIGAAIDFSVMSKARDQLQSQVDAAVLAAATVAIDAGDNRDQEIQTRFDTANQVISANGYDISEMEPVLTLNESTVVLSAKLEYRPFFGGILGMDSVDLSVVSESGLPGAQGVDIVLVLDNTTSMRVDGKLDALKIGATNLVDAIETSDSGSQIGLVPFARYVRLNEGLRNELWLDVPLEFDTPRTTERTIRTGGQCHREPRTRTVDGVRETFQRRICQDQDVSVIEEDIVLNSEWIGCVGSRVPPFSEQDDFYSHKIPGLLTIYPEEETGATFDRDTHCPAEIVPINGDYVALRNQIDGMFTTDETYLPMGVAWGQRVLSPGAPFDNGSENRKIMVLMTDGLNTTEIQQNSVAQQNLHAPPFVGDVDNGDIALAANAATLRVCANAKAAGTEIYTIAFQVTDQETISLLSTCASTADNALTADSNSALIATFEMITESLEADVRLYR